MLSPRPLASSALALALLGLAATLGFTSTARATEPMTISKKITISADLLVDELTVQAGGILEVKQVAAGGTGTIHIRARKINVMKDGVITATRAGLAGANDADGKSANAGSGGKRSMTLGHPGTGGGYFGKGAKGADDKCTPLDDTTGGAAFAMPTATKPILGSAGGAANVTTMGNAGGAGGGVIFLEAAEIVINGTVEARGESPAAVSGVARGAGSGGLIAITAAHLTGTGTITVAGGDGPNALGVGATILANNGGGGAGGVILIKASDLAQTLEDKLEIRGGITGSCGPALDADKGDQQIVIDAAFCVDADGDTATSSACGGLDCDDSDEAIKPGAPEVCNGVDDNCNNATDEDESGTLCPAGRTCDSEAKTCVAISDAGADAGPVIDAGTPPDHITFESGCSLRGGDDSGDSGDSGLALVGLGLGALVTRRRRASRLEKGHR
jgi:MYXO-CTERM domain-containing protein